MNSLKITINPYKQLNTASLNGQPLSPYSELSNYLKAPFWQWADKFWGATEREINDYYHLTIVGEEFDVAFFQDMSRSYDICTTCSSEAFSFSSAPEKRFNAIRKLAEKYGTSQNFDTYKIPLYCSSMTSANRFFVNTPIEDALFIITDDVNLIKSPEWLPKPVFVLFPAEYNEVSCLGSNQYLWKIKKDRLDSILRGAVDRFARIPFLLKVSEELSSVSSLSLHDKQVLELANSIEPLIEIGNMDRLEVGACIDLPVETIPANMPIPKIRIEPQTPGIIDVNGISLCAVGIGETKLNIFKNDEITPFCQNVITTFQNNDVKMILLDRKDPCMGIGRTQKIDITVTPADAKDAKFVVWSINNPDIAVVNDDGVVTAKKAGRCIVTASAQRARESVIIDVLPNIEQMSISNTDVTLYKNESAPISVTYAPQKCFDNSCTWTTSDSNVAEVEVYRDGSSHIRAKEPGECYLTCVANEGTCSVCCHVVVLDPVIEEERLAKEAEKKRHIIDLVCIIGVPALIILLIIIVAMMTLL